MPTNIKPFDLSELDEVCGLAKDKVPEENKESSEDQNTCWNCGEPCSIYSEYQDDGRTFCSLDCLNETTTEEE